MGWCAGFISVQAGVPEGCRQWGHGCSEPGSHQPQLADHPIPTRGVADRNEAKASEELMEEHDRLSQEARVQAAKLEPMHIIDWGEAQEADAALAACCKWLHLRKDMLLPWRDALLKECLGAEAEMEQGKMFFHIHNSLVLSKGLMYVSTTSKGETEGVLAFVVPVGQCCLAFNGVHRDAGHQGQQRTLALAQERFWWPMMAEDCCAIVRGCLCC